MKSNRLPIFCLVLLVTAPLGFGQEVSQPIQPVESAANVLPPPPSEMVEPVQSGGMISDSSIPLDGILYAPSVGAWSVPTCQYERHFRAGSHMVASPIRGHAPSGSYLYHYLNQSHYPSFDPPANGAWATRGPGISFRNCPRKRIRQR